jgi:uncharacterized FlaG/YvyC family protein
MDVPLLQGVQPVATNVSVPVAPELNPNRNLIAAVGAVNQAELLGQNELSFQLDRDSRQPVIRIINRKTKEVVEQIPPEYVLRVAENLKRGR